MKKIQGLLSLLFHFFSNFLWKKKQKTERRKFFQYRFPFNSWLIAFSFIVIFPHNHITVPSSSSFIFRQIDIDIFSSLNVLLFVVHFYRHYSFVSITHWIFRFFFFLFFWLIVGWHLFVFDALSFWMHDSSIDCNGDPFMCVFQRNKNQCFEWHRNTKRQKKQWVKPIWTQWIVIPYEIFDARNFDLFLPITKRGRKKKVFKNHDDAISNTKHSFIESSLTEQSEKLKGKKKLH